MTRGRYDFSTSGVTPVIGAWAGTYVIEDHTGNDTLLESETGSVHTNLGASGTITFTLPSSPATGTFFVFAVSAAQQVRVDPGSATIYDNSGQTVDKYKWADAPGECITLIANSSGDWITVAKNGVWSEET